MMQDKKHFCTNMQKLMLELILKGDVYLNHAPEYEHGALCSQIRSLQYSIDLLFIELAHNRNTLKVLHEIHVGIEKLKHLWRIFYNQGYFGYHKGKDQHSEVKSAKRSTIINNLICNIGSSVGSYIKGTKAELGLLTHS